MVPKHRALITATTRIRECLICGSTNCRMNIVEKGDLIHWLKLRTTEILFKLMFMPCDSVCEECGREILMAMAEAAQKYIKESHD